MESELLAKQGRMAAAGAELGNAQRLEPGLPFAKPQSVQELQRRISAVQTSTPPTRAGAYSPSAMSGGYAPVSSGGIPWGTLIVGLGIVALIVVAIQAMRRRNNATYMPAGAPASYGGSAPQPYGGIGPAPGGPFSGGGNIGSGILGGLATGAALGAGMVAGEALAHRLGEGGHHDAGAMPIPGGDPGQFVSNTPDDMGGNDFGVADSSSWDGGGIGGGGGDWS